MYKNFGIRTILYKFTFTLYYINLIIESCLRSFNTNKIKALIKKTKIEINYSVKICEKINEYCKRISKTKEHKTKISKSLSKNIYVF